MFERGEDIKQIGVEEEYMQFFRETDEPTGV